MPSNESDKTPFLEALSPARSSYESFSEDDQFPHGRLQWFKSRWQKYFLVLFYIPAIILYILPYIQFSKPSQGVCIPPDIPCECYIFYILKKNIRRMNTDEDGNSTVMESRESHVRDEEVWAEFPQKCLCWRPEPRVRFGVALFIWRYLSTPEPLGQSLWPRQRDI